MEKDDKQPNPADTARVTPGREHAGMLIQPWESLSRQLVPLIGENGFGALFGRTLRLVAPRHAWLQVEGTHRTSAALLAALQQAYASADAAAATAAHDELMSTFTRQLGALIGPGLTSRLLAETAIGNENQAKQENQEEHKQ